MANRPVSGQLGYDNAADRPTVELRVGTRKLLTEDDAGGGGAVSDVTGSGAIDVSPTTGNVVVSLDESELENGGAQELSVAGLSGVLADPQTIEVGKNGSLVGTRDKINFVEGTGISLTVADDGGNGEVDVEITASQFNDVASNFWARPASAHASDYEADNATLPSGTTGNAGIFTLWDMSGAPAAVTPTNSGIDMFDTAGPTAGTCRIEAHKPGRRSWVLFQPRAESRNWFYATKVTTPASGVMIVRSRLFSMTKFSAGSNNAGNMKFFILKDGGANAPATLGGANDQAVYMGWEKDAGSMKFRAGYRVAGAQTDTANGAEFQSTMYPQTAECDLVFNGGRWVGIYRSDQLSEFVMDTAGSGISLGTSTAVWAGWLFNGVDGDMPGAPIMGADYLRFDITNTFIP